MKTKIALALCLVLLLPFIAYQQYVITTDNHLLEAMNVLHRGMSADEIGRALGIDAAAMAHENNTQRELSSPYVLRVYMGMITSRNLVVFLDAQKRMSFVTWEKT